MKKMKLLCSILIGLTIFSACSKSNNDYDNEPNNNKHLVKREYISNNISTEYSYNDNGKLTRIIDIYNRENIDDVINYIYDSNNVVSKNFESNNSNYSSITNYSYDANNNLLKTISIINQPSNNVNPTSSIVQDFSYNNNVITVNITSSTGDSKVIILEVNSSGLINKMIENRYYTVIDYDTNGNVTEIKVFDINNNLMDTTGYSYDNKPNPFYNQLKSIYLPLFLHAFRDAFYSEFVWDGYQGYEFPFLKNNITSKTKNENLDIKYNYLYNNKDYPTNVIEEFNGINGYEFDIEYE